MAIRLVQGGAFETRVTAMVPWLKSVALKLTRSPADAQDLVQDAVERALRKSDSFNQDTNLQAWLSSILHHQFIDRCRRKHLEPDELGDTQVAAPTADAEPMWARFTESHVRAMVPKLPEEFRGVFEMHLEGKSYQDISVALQIPRATVGTRLLRARKQLRELLTEEGGAAHG